MIDFEKKENDLKRVIIKEIKSSLNKPENETLKKKFEKIKWAKFSIEELMTINTRL